MEFLKETAIGGIAGGAASVGFYGAGKGIERLKDGFRVGKGALNKEFVKLAVMPISWDSCEVIALDAVSSFKSYHKKP